MLDVNLDMFPLAERQLAQTRLASLLVDVLCQTLVPRADGSGRIAAVEIMINNAPVSSLIRHGKIYQLPNIIRTNHEAGMMSLDEDLARLYKEGIITYDTVLSVCKDRSEVSKLASTETREKKYRTPPRSDAEKTGSGQGPGELNHS